MEVSYAKAVNKIERFMENSGIRNVCSNHCMGRCCQGCYKSEKACRKNEGRRLACSFYMCRPLRELLFTSSEWKLFSTVECIVGDKIRDAFRICTKASRHLYPNIYFEINDRSVRDKFSIDLNVLNKLDKIDINKVISKSSALCSCVKIFMQAKKRVNTNVCM